MQTNEERQAGLIKQARLNAKLTQAELARRTGSSQALIAEMERGRRPIGKILICKIADALGVSVEDLLIGPKDAETGELKMTNAELIRMLRMQERVPGAELAKRLGITPACLHLLESGGAPVSNEMVTRVSDALGMKTYEQGTPETGAMCEARFAIAKARFRSKFMPPPGQA